MSSDLSLSWAEELTEEQRRVLAWLEAHKCYVQMIHAPPDEQDAQEGFVLQVRVDAHALIRERGHDVREVFERVARAARIFVMHGTDLPAPLNQPTGPSQ